MRFADQTARSAYRQPQLRQVSFWVGFGRRQNHLTCAVYCDWGHRMATESLTNVVQSLTPQEQDAVLRFIDYLKGRDVSLGSESPFLQAADEFIA